MRTRRRPTAATGIGSLVIGSAGATTALEAQTRAPPITARVSALVRSGFLRQALIMAFWTGMVLLWIGAAVAIFYELVGWWAALEYSGLTSTTQWPQW